MARFSKIDRRVWNDEKFRSLTEQGRLLWLYLLSNPHVGPIPGLYSAGEAMLAEALDWPLERLRERFGEQLRQGLVRADFRARLIWLPNGIKYNAPENPNVVKGWAAPWDELPECELKGEAWDRLEAAVNARGREFAAAFSQACPKPFRNGLANGSGNGMPNRLGNGMPNQEQEQEQEQENFLVRSANEPCEKSSPRLIKAQRSVMAAKIYNSYPRRQGKAEGVRAIEKSIIAVAKRDFGADENAAADWLLAKLGQYARSAQGGRLEKNLIPMPSTWFNQQRFDDDPDTWNYAGSANCQRGVSNGPSQVDARAEAERATIRNAAAALV